MERTTAGLAVAQNNRHGRHPCKADTTAVKRALDLKAKGVAVPGNAKMLDVSRHHLPLLLRGIHLERV